MKDREKENDSSDMKSILIEWNAKGEHNGQKKETGTEWPQV